VKILDVESPTQEGMRVEDRQDITI